MFKTTLALAVIALCFIAGKAPVKAAENAAGPYAHGPAQTFAVHTPAAKHP